MLMGTANNKCMVRDVSQVPEEVTLLLSVNISHNSAKDADGGMFVDVQSVERDPPI